MNIKTKQVFYCDYCRRHGLSRHAMENHEAKCTLNPDRVCKWGDEGHTVAYGLRVLAEEVRQRAPLDAADIDWLHDEVDGCPACMLAALRQSGVEYHYDVGSGGRLWDYGEEVERYRVAEREAAERATYEDVERSWM